MKFSQNVLSTVGLLIFFLAASDALSCHECDRDNCEKPWDLRCKGGLVKDVCGCCDVCGKVEGEECGGLFYLKGDCDEGLTCVNGFRQSQPGICKALAEAPCRSDQFTCGDGITCIDQDRYCDGEQDCPDAENGDEDQCDAISCAGNLEYTTCGTMCPDKCETMDELPMPCGFMCVAGCFCPYGTYWHREEGTGGMCYKRESCPTIQHVCDRDEPICKNGGSCIRPADESPLNEFICECREGFSGRYCEIEECPHNQVWSNCLDCQKFCDGTTMCAADCPAGCACPPDLPYQTQNGICVAACPQECPHNQKWTTCGTACPLICGQKPKIPCTKNCVLDVCQCPPRSWQKTDGSCVKYEHECDVHYVEPQVHICDEKKDICNDNGVCIRQGEGYLCACNKMYYGKNCQHHFINGWFRRLMGSN